MRLLRGSRWIAITAASCAITVLGACSFVLSREQGQCNSHADCAARGGPFINSACSDTHVCVPLPVEGGVTTASTTCTKNSDCAQTIGLGLCRNQQCLSLRPPGLKCESIDLGQTVDDAVPIGFLLPLDATIEDQTELKKTAKLAINEFVRTASNPNVKGLPPLVGVICDEADPPSIDYMLGSLQVKLVVGPTQLANLNAVLSKTRGAGAVLMTTIADDPVLEATPNSNADGLFWSVRPNRLRQLSYFGAAIQHALSLAKLQPTAKVLLAVGSDSPTAGFVTRFQQLGDAGVQLDVHNYKARTDPTWIDYSELVGYAISTQPELIVAASSVDRWDDIITNIEKGWGPGKRPFYLLGDKVSLVEKQVRIEEGLCSCGLPARVMGLSFHHDPTVYGAFSRAYQGANASAQPPYGSERSYDAIYESVYAALLGAKKSNVPVGAVTGANFKAAVEAFNGPDGQRKDIGAVPIPEVVGGLDQKIDLMGASGPLDFDVGNGTPTADGELYCYNENSFCDTGIVFKAGSAGPPTGTNTCANCFK